MAKVRIIKDNFKRFGGLQVLMQSDDWKELMSFVDRELTRGQGITVGFAILAFSMHSLEAN